jgi:RNA polymerase sigma factor (sigma-70 family)
MTPTPANDNTPRPAWFDQLLAQYEPFLRKRCGVMQPASPEDAYQEAVYRAMEQWASYRQDGHFPTWLNYVVRHIQFDNKRREFKRVYQPVTVTPATQETRLIIQDVLGALPRRAASLVCMQALGYTMTEMAKKRRVSRRAIYDGLRDARVMIAANDNVKQDKKAA